MATFNLGGRNQFGEVFGLHLMDPLAGGSGAYSTKDGVCAGGPINAPMPSIADVERNEQVAPLFYLHRRLAQDTGGAGMYRGGRSAEVALTLGGIRQADALIMTHGAEVPNTPGLAGGWPGSTVVQRFAQGAVKGGRLTGQGDFSALGPKPGMMPMTNEDVFSVTWQGGGGWGDPLERDLDALQADLIRGVVSPEGARAMYGAIVVEQNQIDREATKVWRTKLKQQRLGSQRLVSASTPDPDAAELGQLNDVLRLVRDGRGVHVVSPANHILCTNTTAWRVGSVSRTLTSTPAQSRIALHHELAMTEWYCPVGGTLLAVDVHRQSQAPVDDVMLVL